MPIPILFVPVTVSIVSSIVLFLIIRAFVKDKKVAVFGCDIASAPNLIAALKSETKSVDDQITEGDLWRDDFQHYKQWKPIFQDSDIVIYWIPLAKILPNLDSMIEKRISDDAGQFYRWIKDRPRRHPCVVVGVDDRPEYLSLFILSKGHVFEFPKELREVRAINDIIRALGGEKGVVTGCGRSAPLKYAKKLVQMILRKVKEFKKPRD